MSSYNTLNGNDIQVFIRMGAGGGGSDAAGLRVYNFIHYTASLVIGKNNQYNVLDR